MINIIHDPSLVVNKIIESTYKLLMGRSLGFVACMIVVNILFMFFKTITKSNYVMLLAISTMIAGIGFGLSFLIGGEVHAWSADTALVYQWFFTLGHLLRIFERQEWYVELVKKATITEGAYVIIVIFITLKFGFSLVHINVAENIWGKVWLTIPLIILCQISALFSSRIFRNLKLVTFFGQNSLLYFALGSHGMSVMNKIFVALYEKTGWELLSNRAIINPIIAFSGATILIPGLLAYK